MTTYVYQIIRHRGTVQEPANMPLHGFLSNAEQTCALLNERAKETPKLLHYTIKALEIVA